jgi:hypothetical protein
MASPLQVRLRHAPLSKFIACTSLTLLFCAAVSADLWSQGKESFCSGVGSRLLHEPPSDGAHFDFRCPLQKSAVAVAYAKPGKGLVKLNGERRSWMHMHSSQYSMKRRQSSSCHANETQPGSQQLQEAAEGGQCKRSSSCAAIVTAAEALLENPHDFLGICSVLCARASYWQAASTCSSAAVCVYRQQPQH